MDYEKIEKLARVVEKSAGPNDMAVENTDEQQLAVIQGKVYPAIGIDLNTSTPNPKDFNDNYLSPWLGNAMATGKIPQKLDAEGYAIVPSPWGAKFIASPEGVKVVGVAGGKVIEEISAASKKAQMAARGLQMPKTTLEAWINKQ